MDRAGTAIAGAGTSTALRDAPRLVAEYGGEVSHWAKVAATPQTLYNGMVVQTHGYMNVVTRQIVELKSKTGF
jgi:filamentous hemagglutinin